MGRSLSSVLAMAFFSVGFFLAMPIRREIAPVEEASVLQADHEFVQGAAKGDSAAVAKLLDTDFTWTDAEGKSLSRADVLSAIPKPSLGDETGAHRVRQTRSQVEAIMADRDKVHVLRLWVKRGAAWRLLVYHDATLVAKAHPPAGSGLTDCENPCKTIPYQAKNADEQGVISSWQALETAVTGHDAQGWAPHIADEFTLTNSNNDHVMTKADRMAILDKQKQTGANSAPSPLVSAKMYDFPDAIVMTAQHQTGDHKPTHVTRVWIHRDGVWQMAISQQTTIE